MTHTEWTDADWSATLEDVTPTERKKAHSPHQPTGQWISTKKRLAIYIRDGFSCVYCGSDLRNAAPAEIALDHLIPRSNGGTNNATNLVTACRSCNSARGNKAVADYAPGGALDRIARLIVQPLNLKLAESILNGTQSAMATMMESVR